MVILNEAQMATMGDQRFSTIQESGQHNSVVDIDLLVFLDIGVVSDTFILSTEGAVCLSQPIVHFFIYISIICDNAHPK